MLQIAHFVFLRFEDLNWRQLSSGWSFHSIEGRDSKIETINENKTKKTCLGRFQDWGSIFAAHTNMLITVLVLNHAQ
jgi:hypothetical protein